MKVLTKTLTASALTTALLASTSLFANTTANTSANVQVQTSQPSVLQNLKHDVKHAAHATGETVEHGVDKTKAFSKEKWQDTKEFSAEKSAVVKDKAGDVKDASLKASPSLKGVVVGTNLFSKASKKGKTKLSSKALLPKLDEEYEEWMELQA